MFVIICRSVDLFVLFRLSILILVFGKKFREMFLRILCLGGIILFMWFMEYMYWVIIG